MSDHAERSRPPEPSPAAGTGVGVRVFDVTAAHAELRAGYRRALERSGGVGEPLIEIAGTPLRLRIVGSALATAILRPFVHLRIDDATPRTNATWRESSIELWSSDETAVPAPELAWPSPRGMASSADGAITILAQRGSITALDRRAGSIVGRRESVASLTADELTKPLAELLPLFLLDRGTTIVHSAMVARGGAGALIAGPPGAGKSTASLACAAAGMEWLGDDQVALTELSNGTLLAHSFCCVARLDPAYLRRRPELACGVDPVEPTGAKSLLFLAESACARVARRAAPRTILVPIAGTNSHRAGLAPISGAAALRALAPSSLLGVIGGGASGFIRLASLAERLPCFEMRHGGEPRRIPELVDEALRRSGAG